MKLTNNLKMRILVIFVLSYVFGSSYKIDTYCGVLQNDDETTQVSSDVDSNSTNIETEDPEIYEIKVIGAVKGACIEQAEENLELVPDEIMNNFVKEGWKFYITTRDINEEYFNSRYNEVLGVTSYKEKCIKVMNEEFAIELAVIHEVGHYFDYLTKFSSVSDEFRQIYEEEIGEFRKKIEAGVQIFNEREFFAQTFYYLIKDPSKCTPKALEFVEEQLEIFLQTLDVQLNI